MTVGRLVILAGGISSRMKKFDVIKEKIDPHLIDDANLKAKSMIGVGDNYRPFLDYLLYNAREAGYADVLIVIGEKDESVKSYYGIKDKNNNFHGLNISYAVQKIPSGRVKPAGTADALYQGLITKKEWKGKKFTVCNSDNLYSQKALSIMLNIKYPNAMIGYNRDALEFEISRIEKFAITVRNSEGYLVDIIEKPTKGEMERLRIKNGVLVVSMNIFCLNYDHILRYLNTLPYHPVRKEKELPMAIKMMIKENSKSVFAYPLSEHVPDLTDKDDIIPVKKYLKKYFTHPLFE